jgi:hypothetical protein
MILLWDSDSGLAQLDKYLHSNDIHVVAGALLGIGIVSCGVKSDCDPVCPYSKTSNAQVSVHLLKLLMRKTLY